MNANNPRCDIDEALYRALAVSIRSCKYDYARGTMILYLFTSINIESAIYTTAAHSVDGMRLVKYGYYMVILDRCDRSRSMEMLRE